MRRAMMVAILLTAAPTASAQIFITEWMYSGSDGEFIEFTNVGAAPVDMTGWSFDDDSRVPGSADLSALGVVAPGESVVLSELDEATFRANWGGLPGVTVMGGNIVNLGRNDEINLYDALDALVDRLTYGDQNIPGSIRTQDFSGWVSAAGLGANDVFEWTLSSLGDVQNSMVGANGNIASPGRHVIPEPATMLLMLLAAMRRRR